VGRRPKNNTIVNRMGMPVGEVPLTPNRVRREGALSTHLFRFRRGTAAPALMICWMVAAGQRTELSRPKLRAMGRAS